MLSSCRLLLGGELELFEVEGAAGRNPPGHFALVPLGGSTGGRAANHYCHFSKPPNPGCSGAWILSYVVSDGTPWMALVKYDQLLSSPVRLT